MCAGPHGAIRTADPHLRCSTPCDITPYNPSAAAECERRNTRTATRSCVYATWRRQTPFHRLDIHRAGESDRAGGPPVAARNDDPATATPAR